MMACFSYAVLVLHQIWCISPKKFHFYLIGQNILLNNDHQEGFFFGKFLNSNMEKIFLHLFLVVET